MTHFSREELQAITEIAGEFGSGRIGGENQLDWLTVIFLPKRSPNLNPLETKVNRNLKKDVCANHNYVTEENLVKAVRRYLRCIGSWPKL